MSAASRHGATLPESRARHADGNRSAPATQRLYGQTFASFGAPPRDDPAASDGRHSFSKTMDALAFPIAGLAVSDRHADSSRSSLRLYGSVIL